MLFMAIVFGLTQALAVHPTFGIDSRQPILSRRDPPEVLSHMLFSDVADGNLDAVVVADYKSEKAFCQKDTLGVMAKRAVAEVREKRLRFVKPAMDRQIVLGFAAEFSGAALRMFKRMSHGYTSYVLVL